MHLHQGPEIGEKHTLTRIGANIRLHGGWSHPWDALRTPYAIPVAFCWAMESFIKPKINKKKNIYKNRGAL
jgi:hypothetical protein